jgi:two-component system alkaline phosphatase synthesis response regulator PhoP
MLHNRVSVKQEEDEKSSPDADVYDDGLLRVEHENYYVACDGSDIKLPRTEFLIISRLVRKPGRFVQAEELWRYAWGERKAFNAVSLHVYIYRLRSKLSPFGVQIETLVGVGYRLSSARGSYSEGLRVAGL